MKKMKHLAKVFTGCAAALFFMSVTTGCSNDNSTDLKPGKKEVQLTTNSKLGSILTDQEGRTLYYFANDATSVNNCTGDCELIWPPFHVENLSADKLGTGLSLADFKTIKTGSGKKQLVYKGRPLYYYAPVVNGKNTLEAPGQTKGENVQGVWFVAKPDYTIMLTNAQLVGLDGKNYTSTYKEGKGKTLYFTDGNGVTLYTFTNDKKNKNTFTKQDFSNNNVWSIYEKDKIVVPSSLNKSDFGSIIVFGKKQLTYKGWPLYQFGQDKMVMGSNKGVSFPKPGGIWPVAVKDLSFAKP